MGSAHVPDVLVEALSRGLPADRLVTDPDVLAAISHDDAEWAPTGQAAVGATALLLARVDTPGDSGAAEANDIAATMTDVGALWVEQSTDNAEAEALFEARRLAYPALERLGPVLTEDVCVTRSRVPATACAVNSTRDRSPCSQPCAARLTRVRSSTQARASRHGRRQ